MAKMALSGTEGVGTGAQLSMLVNKGCRKIFLTPRKNVLDV